MHEHTQKSQAYPLDVIEPSTIFVGVDYVAALLGEKTSSIYNKSCAGRLPFPAYKAGASIRFKYSQILEWVDSLKPIPVRAKKKNTPAPQVSGSIKRGRGRPPKAEQVARLESESQLSNSQSA